METNNEYENYLRDLGFLLKEKVDEIKQREPRELESEDYLLGYKRALYEITALMKNQALAFQIDESKINLDKIDPDKDLLTYRDE